MKIKSDIDIDFSDRNEILSKIPHRLAILENGARHPSGVYVTEIPHDPFTNQCTFDYKEASRRGYFKIDFLNVSIYKDVRDNQHIIELMNKEPLWDLLLENQFVDQLFHLAGHGEILKKTCPRSVEQLAAVLAMLRPAKRHLIGKPWKVILKEVWTKPETGEYSWKKSHAVAYALAVVMQLNLICEQLSNEIS